MDNAPFVAVQQPPPEQQHQQRLLAMAPWKRSSDVVEDTHRHKWSKRPSVAGGDDERWRWTRRLSTGGKADERTRWSRRLSTISASSTGGGNGGVSGGNGATEVTHPTFNSDVAARAYLARQRASSARRAMPDSAGLSLRLVTARAGGDCGFEAVCWGLQTGRGYGPSARELRRITRDHVLANRASYVRACGDTRAVGAFCRSVVRPGLAGHWLGSSWGALEIIAVARAVGNSITVYTFDTKLQRFRAYFEEAVNEDKHPAVRLLFTGDADRGHFDCLVPEKKSLIPALWRRRFVRKLESRCSSVCGRNI